MKMNIIVRQGTLNDLPSVLDMVKGLAKFEKAADSVTATLEDYSEAYADGLITIHIAEVEEAVVGCTLFYNTFSTWKGKMLYLEDFYVLDEYRGQGIGKKLFYAFITEAKKRNCALAKWQVLDWNTAAIKFYEREGATIEKEWWNGKIIF